MNFTKKEKRRISCVVVSGEGKAVTDVQSALDLLMTAGYEAGTKNIAIDKNMVTEDFFILSTGLAGEILQKYINYGRQDSGLRRLFALYKQTSERFYI